MFQCVDIGWDTFWDTFGTKSVTETLTKKWNEAGGTNTCHRVSCPVHRFIMSFHGNQIGDMVLLTFQMEQNGTFWDNSKYDDWILHKKLI